MGRRKKESDVNLYYMNKGQAKREKSKETKKKKKLKENKKKKPEDKFDLETETVIQMTNKNKIKKEEQKRKETNKKLRKKQKRNKKIKIFLKLILILGLISGGIAFLLTSPIFNIKEIKVLNNEKVASDTIVSLSELKNEENIFKFYIGNVVSKIKENAYVENVRIVRKLPSTVEMTVEERTAKYSVDYMGKYAYINTQGYILEISDDSKNLPIIEGITTNEEQVVPKNRLNNEDLLRLEDVIKIESCVKDNNLDSKVTNIDITNKNEYSIYLEEEKKKIHLGDNTNLSNKMLYVVAIIEQEKGKEGDIYVNGDLNNKFQPYFKEKV